jgi:hypothetical protein
MGVLKGGAPVFGFAKLVQITSILLGFIVVGWIGAMN